VTIPSITCELYTDWACAGGTAVGVLRVLSGSYTEALDNTDAMSIVVLQDDRVTVGLRQVLRITDASGAVREYRVQARSQTYADGLRQIKGIGPLADLATTGLVRSIVGGATTYALGGTYTPTDAITNYVLANLSADGVSWLALGTISPPSGTAAVTLSVPAGGWTRLEWLRAIADATGGELRLRRNGETQYLIDLLTTTGSSAAVIPLTFGKQLVSVQNDDDDGELATAITVQGATPSGQTVPSGLGENAWTIGTITGSGPYWVPLTDPAGGVGPVAFASQFGTASTSQAAYLLTKTATTVQITDSRISPDNAVQVASTAGLTAGDQVQFVADTSATRLTELRTPNVSRLHRLDTVSSITGGRNLALNGTFGSWTTDSQPTGWTVTASDLYRYPRTNPTTFTLTVTTGQANLTNIPVTGPANLRLYPDEPVRISGTDFYRVAAFTQLDGSGVGTVSLTDVSNGTAIAIATGATITQSALYATRAAFPSDGLSSDTAKPSVYSATSPSFVVKYVSGLPVLGFAVGATHVGAANYRFGSNPASWTLQALTYADLRDTVASTTLATVNPSSDLALGATRHDALVGSYTLTGDKTVAVRLTPYQSGYGTQARDIGHFWRYVTLWLSPTAVAAEPFVYADATGGNLLWQRANRALLARALGARQLRVTLNDLSAAAGYVVGREQLTLGGTIQLDDIGVSVRAIAITYSATDPQNVQVLLDSRPTRLVKFLAERL
jgi:hypothetical protein